MGNRRSLILATLAAAAAGIAGAAPVPGRKLLIGVLVATDERSSTTRALFEPALRRRGYVEGQGYAFEFRFADNHYDRLEALAADLVARKVDVIVAGGTPPTLAARKATSTIPIVSVGGASPVGLGLAASLAHPGGNVTGVINVGGEVVAKGMEFLRKLVPAARRVGMPMNPDNPASALSPEWLRDKGREFGVELVGIAFRSPRDLEQLARERAGIDALYIRLDATLNSHVEAFARFTLAQRLPAMGSLRQFVPAGGLASYGQSYEEQWNSVAEYVDRIANGAKASELPIMQPTRFELGLNRATAAALGVRIPQELMVRADFFEP